MGEPRAGAGEPGCSIVVPVHNEAGTVEHAVPAMLKAAEQLGVPFEIIVCENGSHDETPALVVQLAASDSRIRSESLEVGDYGRALQHAIGVARYEDVIIFNVDYWSAKFLATALTGLTSHDMVIGSKVLGRDRRPLFRRIITRTFNLFLRMSFGFRGTDTHGMKAFRRAAGGALAAECVSEGWIFDTELVLRAERHGLTIVEKPVNTREVRAPSYTAIVGRVPITLLNLARMWRGLRILPHRVVPSKAALVDRDRPCTVRRVSARRAVVCLLGLLVLVIWQLSLFRMDWPSTATLEVKASTGLRDQDRFLYFLYYANLFPVASLQSGRDYQFTFGKDFEEAEPDVLEYSPEAARQVLRDEGSTLVMEWGHTIRGGQALSTYLFLPDAWRLGSPQWAEIRITHAALFIGALAGLYLMSWWVGMPVFGSALVLLIGSSPFQLYEAYRHENIFSWPITSFCILLQLMLPLLVNRRASPRYAVCAAIAAGLFVATSSQIRPEPIVMLSGVVFAFLGATMLGWRMRGLAVVLLLATTGVGLFGWNSYSDHKFEQAADVVGRAGGHVLTGAHDRYHTFWSPIWSGLGDFDTTHGYAWSDLAAVGYVQPILESRYGEELPWWWGVKGKEDRDRTADDYVDAARMYYRLPFHAPHYDDVLRDKVLGDIIREPSWYAGILARRFARISTETVKPQITLSTTAVLPVPFPSLVVLPLLMAACVLRRWSDVRIVLFSYSLSLPALLVYSGLGVTNYSVYHLCALALVLCAVIEWVHRRVASRNVVPVSAS